MVDKGRNIDRESISYSLHGNSSSKTFRAFNAVGAIAFSFGDAMLPETHKTLTEPAEKECVKAYHQHALFQNGQIVMANLLVVIQISGCYQIYCRPTHAYFEETMLFHKSARHIPLRDRFIPYLKAGRMPRDTKLRHSMQLLNCVMLYWVALAGAVRLIIEDTKTHKFFNEMIWEN
ncbi:hypothetical protein CICLE_v10024437mg [Citrus x clementina]|uniref:Aa trans domain-containing protein n=2 Tax=Citrus TaxID=2706 RepID=A0ACB8MI05_CITSI|nr:hypothetical protein CICLE_v10024437mg [Citrus x clementina]KAH9785538.1 Aa trans domain-containing protein [Citrus sinensis]